MLVFCEIEQKADVVVDIDSLNCFYINVAATYSCVTTGNPMKKIVDSPFPGNKCFKIKHIVINTAVSEIQNTVQTVIISQKKIIRIEIMMNEC